VSVTPPAYGFGMTQPSHPAAAGPGRGPAVRILHTADWQLGMTRHFLDPDGQARFSGARIDAIRRLGEVARREGCDAIVVAGDVFETNQVSRRVVVRALEAMADTGLPVLLLPGNHDPLDPTSVYRSPTFITQRPDNVVVLDGVAAHPIVPGVEIIGAPWRSKRPVSDLCADAVSGLVADGTVRVLVGHGAVDTMAPEERDDPSWVHVEPLVAALDDGRLHYVALGDRHSFTAVEPRGRIVYSGAPEPTAFDEVDPGNVVVVEVTRSGVDVRPVAIAAWRFVTIEAQLDDDTDLDELCSRLDLVESKDTTIVRVGLRGSVSLDVDARLETALAERREVFAALEVWSAGTDLARVPDIDSLDDLGLKGASRAAAADLQAAHVAGGADAQVALDALALLHRLARSAA
jgi:DNA repair exonuclease SbcCD nuclease subunit